jgi:transcription elongation factor GreA
MAQEHFQPITKSGLDKLKGELEHLKKKERVEVIESIKVARAHGDLSENAEYDAAKERQGHLEARISELEKRIQRAHIIDATSQNEIIFGAHVKVKEVGANEVEEFHLVGDGESNPAAGKISTASPMGKAFIKKKKGDIADVITPGGVIKMEIVDFWYE